MKNKKNTVIEEEYAIIFGQKKKIRSIKMNEPITRCNKHIEKNIKENRKVLQLSMKESNQDIISN